MRNLLDWELEEFYSLVELLYGQDLLIDRSDVWRWRESRVGLFTVKSFYKRLLRRDEHIFPHCAIWVPRFRERCVSLPGWQQGM